jgi:hypothetical protein
MILKSCKSQWGGCSRDRRRSARYPVAGAVWFQWKEADGAQHAGSGVTHDIGKAGVFVESESLPPLATTIRLDVGLALDWSPNAMVRLRGVGDVRHLRSKACARSGYGAAVVFHIETSATEEDLAEE